MIHAKIKLLRSTSDHIFSTIMEDFLKTIDVRQIIKTEYAYCDLCHSTIIYYVNYEDIRDAKLSNILDLK